MLQSAPYRSSLQIQRTNRLNRRKRRIFSRQTFIFKKNNSRLLQKRISFKFNYVMIYLIVFALCKSHKAKNTGCRSVCSKTQMPPFTKWLSKKRYPVYQFEHIVLKQINMPGNNLGEKQEFRRIVKNCSKSLNQICRFQHHIWFSFLLQKLMFSTFL